MVFEKKIIIGIVQIVEILDAIIVNAAIVIAIPRTTTTIHVTR